MNFKMQIFFHKNGNFIFPENEKKRKQTELQPQPLEHCLAKFLIIMNS